MESGAILGEQVYVAVTWKAQEDSVRQAARAEGLTRGQRRASPCCMQVQGRVYWPTKSFRDLQL